MKMNCNNCRYIDYFEADYESSDQSGFMCEGREYYDARQKKLEENMQRKEYREKAKSCCVLNLVQNGSRYCFDYLGNKVFEGDTVEYYPLTKCQGGKKVGVIKCIGDMNEKQVNMPYIVGVGAYSPLAIIKII